MPRTPSSKTPRSTNPKPAIPPQDIPITPPRLSRKRKLSLPTTTSPAIRPKRTPTKAKVSYTELGSDSEDIENLAVSLVQKSKEKEVVAVKSMKKQDNKKVKIEAVAVTASTPEKKNEKSNRAVVKKDEKDSDVEAEKKPRQKRKTKEEKEAESMALAARTTGLNMFVGAHVSMAKGVQNSVTNSVHIGGNAFALFLKSQRKWESPPLKPEDAKLYRESCEEHKYDRSRHVLPHGSYLVNLANPMPEMAKKSYDSFLEDLQRCEALGIKLYNFHPGNTGPFPRPEAIRRIATALNKAHSATKSVVTVLENMAAGGNVIGSTFSDLKDIISLIDDKSRVGVCIDTCHTFAAGYDLRSPAAFKKTMGEFEDIVGMKYLRALHLNDSKAPFAAHRDLHQNIGLGFLGLRAFHNVMNFKPFEDLPLILETPIDVPVKDSKPPKTIEDKKIWAAEIKLLESLIGMDPESEEFRVLEKQLADKGQTERQKYQESYEKKLAKDKKKLEKGASGIAKYFGGSSKSKGKENTEESDEEGGGCNHSQGR